MVLRLLAWASLAATILFAILSMVALFAGDALGANGPAVAWYGALTLLVLAILLAVATLVVAGIASRDE